MSDFLFQLFKYEILILNFKISSFSFSLVPRARFSLILYYSGETPSVFFSLFLLASCGTQSTVKSRFSWIPEKRSFAFATIVRCRRQTQLLSCRNSRKKGDRIWWLYLLQSKRGTSKVLIKVGPALDWTGQREDGDCLFFGFDRKRVPIANLEHISEEFRTSGLEKMIGLPVNGSSIQSVTKSRVPEKSQSI